MFKKPRFRIKKSKAQSVIIQFVLFFLMGFGIFVGVGMLFKMRSDIFQGDVATASLKLTSSYLTSTAIASMGCVECDVVESKVTILNTSAGYFTEVILSGEGIETSTAPKFREHISSMHNLNETLQLDGSAPSIITMSIVYDRLQDELNITSKYTLPSCLQDGSACVIGEACCNGICEDGVCTSFCDICGAPCSEGSYAYDDGTHTCDGDVNDACNPIIGTYHTCDESGDARDADCQANCQPGLSYCYSNGNPPFYWGRCVDLQSDDCSCGTCGNVCPDGTDCQDGSCVSTEPTYLAGYWEFEEGSGTVVGDSSGNGNDGVLYGDGDEWVTGRIGTGLGLDGNGDYVSIADSNSLDVDYVTLSAWIYVNNYQNDQRIISKEFGTTQPYNIYTLLLSGSNNRKLQFRIARDGQSVRDIITGDTDIPLDEWTHVSATFNGTAAVLYIDGEFEIANYNLPGTIRDTDTSVYIGASEFYSPRFFDGIIDDARIYNVALTDSEVLALYNSAPPPP